MPIPLAPAVASLPLTTTGAPVPAPAPPEPAGAAIPAAPVPAIVMDGSFVPPLEFEHADTSHAAHMNEMHSRFIADSLPR